MKKNLLKLIFAIVFVFTFINSFSQSWQDQYFDGADSAFTTSSLYIKIDTSANNIWQVGKPQKVIFDSAATLPNALVTDTINFYPNNNISRFSFSIPIYGSWGILGIQWKQKLDMDLGLDGGMVEYSIDTGATWQSAFNNPAVYNFFGYPSPDFDTLATGEYAFSGTDSLWRDVWLCYDLSFLTTWIDTIRVRYTFISDSINNNKEGWMIDNMNAHVTMLHPVKENVSTEYFNVYPNPAKNIVNVELQRLNEYHIIENMQLVNSEGKLMQEWNKIPTRYWIDVSKYANGMYYLKIKSNLKSKTVPILIQK